MQTFLPYSDFSKSAECLDNKRLNKQITEAKQIIYANIRYAMNIKSGWQNHPAVKMWRGFDEALMEYHNACVDEWHKRGFTSHNKKFIIIINRYEPPFWLGNEKFHVSHQSNLIRKLPEHYRKYFPDVVDNLPYYWPV